MKSETGPRNNFQTGVILLSIAALLDLVSLFNSFQFFNLVTLLLTLFLVGTGYHSLYQRSLQSTRFFNVGALFLFTLEVISGFILLFSDAPEDVNATAWRMTSFLTLLLAIFCFGSCLLCGVNYSKVLKSRDSIRVIQDRRPSSEHSAPTPAIEA